MDAGKASFRFLRFFDTEAVVIRRDLLLFGSGLIFGSAATYFLLHSVFRPSQSLPPDDLPPAVELKLSRPVSIDNKPSLESDDIRSMLQRLAKEANLKLVLSDRVQGTVTMQIDPDTSPRAAIEIIVTAKGLIMDEGGDTLYVKTAEELAKEPTEHGRYTFRNARAANVTKLLFRQLRSGVEPSADERTNTIFYVELRSNMDTIKEFLEFVDQPLPIRQ